MAPSTFGSQKCQKLLKSAGFGALLDVEMWKSARRCGTKHIWKSKVINTDGLGPLLDVQMLKTCTQILQPRLRLQYTTADYKYYKYANYTTRNFTTITTTTATATRTTTTTTLDYNYNYTTLHYARLHCSELQNYNYNYSYNYN